MQAAAETARPVHLLSLLAMGAGLASSNQVAQLPLFAPPPSGAEFRSDPTSADRWTVRTPMRSSARQDYGW